MSFIQNLNADDVPQLLQMLLTAGILAAMSVMQGVSSSKAKKLLAHTTAATEVRRSEEWQNVREWLQIILKDLITEAENRYLEPGSGNLRMAYVQRRVLELLPSDLRAQVDAGELEDLIEGELRSVRQLWKLTPDVLVSNRLTESFALSEDVPPQPPEPDPNEDVESPFQIPDEAGEQIWNFILGKLAGKR